MLYKNYLNDENENGSDIVICYWNKIDSPIGEIHLAATDEGLVYCASARQNG